MRTILALSLVAFLGLVGVTLAGSAPEVAAPAAGCHGRVPVQAGCHGLTLKAPAAVQAEACHGRAAGRLTLSERHAARSMARSNYRATLNAARAAGRAGDGIQAVNYEAPAMTMVPAASACDACNCSPCNCK